MTHEEKKTVVAELSEMLRNADCTFFVNIIGQTVAEVTEFRRRIRGSDSHLRQVKNTLTRLALSEIGRGDALHLVDGPTALAVSAHPVELSKVLVGFTKDHEDKLEIRGGWLFDKMLDYPSVLELSKCPPQHEMRAKALGLLAAPMINLLSLLNQIPASFLRVLRARISIEGGEG
ncbi:50S ribosomal protein L10 [bacterium]|nr:50S ribosomal protein L10 [bacterium]